LDDEFVAVEPVRDRLEEQEDGHGDRDLDLSRRRRPVTLRLQTQTTEEVVHDDTERKGDKGCGEGESEEEPQERQFERVERHIKTELRVGHPEGCGIAPLQEAPPLARSRQSAEKPENNRQAQQQASLERFDRLPVTLQAGLLRGGPGESRPRSVGDPRREQHNQGHHDAESEKQQTPGQERDRVHLRLVDGGEPQPIGVEAREKHERHDDGRQDTDGRKQDASASPLRSFWASTPRGEVECHERNLRHQR